MNSVSGSHIALVVVNSLGEQLFELLSIEDDIKDGKVLRLNHNIPKEAGFKTDGEGKLIPFWEHS